MTDKKRQQRSLLQRLTPTQPFVFLIGVFVLGLLFFAAFRLLFFFSFSKELAGVPAGDILKAFLIGVRFDQIIILAFLIPPLLVLPWLPMRFKTVRMATATYLGIVFSVSFLALLADIPFYNVFESRLNFQAVEYLSGGRTTWHLILTHPRFYQFLAVWAAATILFVLAVGCLYRRTTHIKHRRSWKGQLSFLVIFLALALLGIRGRTYLSPINWGMAYMGQNPCLNQLGLNGAYTLARVFTEEGKDPRLTYLPESARFPFVPFGEALDSVQTMLHQRDDRWLVPDSSLARETEQPLPKTGFQPNIVIVMMESWSGNFTGALGCSRGLTPHFDSLAAHGILFTNFYANGTRTNFGLAATLCSYPSIPGRSVMARFSALHPFRSLASILGDRGYLNVFAYGGDLAFDNMEGFFRTQGFDEFYGDESFGRELDFAKWGIPDEIVFDRVTGLTDSLRRPFQVTVMTLSNHEPFDLPDSSVQKYSDKSDTSKVYNALAYSDFAIGKFMERIRTEPVFDSTIFVFVSDHAHYGPALVMLDPDANFHIPLLIYSPAIIGDSGRVVAEVGSQVDIIPTLMGILGDSYWHESWGRNLLRLPHNDSGFAVVCVLNRVGYIERDGFYFEHIGKPGKLLRRTGTSRAGYPEYSDINNPLRSETLERRLHYYLQSADQLSTPGATDKLP